MAEHKASEPLREMLVDNYRGEVGPRVRAWTRNDWVRAIDLPIELDRSVVSESFRKLRNEPRYGTSLALKCWFPELARLLRHPRYRPAGRLSFEETLGLDRHRNHIIFVAANKQKQLAGGMVLALDDPDWLVAGVLASRDHPTGEDLVVSALRVARDRKRDGVLIRQPLHFANFDFGRFLEKNFKARRRQLNLSPWIPGTAPDMAFAIPTR